MRENLCGQDILRWEFIKENRKVRKQEIKKTKTRFLGRVLVFLFSYFLDFFYKFPPQEKKNEKHGFNYG